MYNYRFIFIKYFTNIWLGSISSSPTNQRRSRSLSLQNGRPQNILTAKTSTISSKVHTHQIYLALIILLMLSEDDFFKKVIHEMVKFRLII